ncbi:MAG: signal recognition particle-docking protein FtsY [Alphaproteobacteria bacterium]|nr:signal recognition particle-docking protein FtsY [Alphaproteobacteria bacterium]
MSEDGDKKSGFFSRLTKGLARSAAAFTGFIRRRKLDEDTLDELEELLLRADLGPHAVARVLEEIKASKFNAELSEAELKEALAKPVEELLRLSWKRFPFDPAKRPHVVLVVGVNGAGKTTTIGKLAQKFTAEGKKIVLAAGDTFRAAAIEQLKIWGERTGAPVIAREQGGDAAGLAFEAFERAKAEGADLLFIDTAGRLQNKTGLMQELQKIVRVLKKIDPDAPHSTLLVLDATVGQNAIQQVEVFREIAGVTGLVMTKLDGTARGGILVALADKFGMPIYWIGVGETAEDLQLFDPYQFARALVGANETA